MWRVFRKFYCFKIKSFSIKSSHFVKMSLLGLTVFSHLVPPLAGFAMKLFAAVVTRLETFSSFSSLRLGLDLALDNGKEMEGN